MTSSLDGDEPTRPRWLLRDPRLLRLRQHVRANLHRPIPLPEAAATACVSSSHFPVFFKAATGMTWSQYLRLVRVRRAQALLLRGESVLAAALAVGYDCDRSLERSFRAVLGRTPAQWRDDRLRGN